MKVTNGQNVYFEYITSINISTFTSGEFIFY